MAHFIYEYSANLPRELLDMPALMEKMHAAASASGLFPLDGLRSRAIRCEEFRVGDGNPDNGFVNLSMRVGQGRDIDTRLAVGRQLFDILVDHLQPLLARRGLAISFEMRELEAQLKFNYKNL
jgi:5-carboxymethyl-2-hydroxymuconate isomerase